VADFGARPETIELLAQDPGFEQSPMCFAPLVRAVVERAIAEKG
jgi:hypothetical protein